MEKINVAMCDDVVYICEYFQSIIDSEDNMEFVGMAHNEEQTIHMVEDLKPDVLLMDMQMDSAESGINLIPVVQLASPETKIIVISVHEEPEYIFKALSLGANDYIIKSQPSEEVIKKIRDICNNETVLNSNIAKILISECQKVQNQQRSSLFMLNLIKKLTNTEFDILKAIYYGQSYKEIARQRYVEESTIRVHVSSILKKFEYSSMNRLIDTLKDLGIADIFNW